MRGEIGAMSDAVGARLQRAPKYAMEKTKENSPIPSSIQLRLVALLRETMITTRMIAPIGLSPNIIVPMPTMNRV